MAYSLFPFPLGTNRNPEDSTKRLHIDLSKSLKDTPHYGIDNDRIYIKSKMYIRINKDYI